jgi:hypothetical protein
MKSRRIMRAGLAAGAGLALGATTGLGQTCGWDFTYSDPGLGTSSQNVGQFNVFNGELYITGSFQTPLSRVARWTGSGFADVGGGLGGGVNDATVWNNNLVAVGAFQTAGGNPALRVARYDGTSWHAMGDGFGSAVGSVGVWNGELYVGGNFSASGSTPIIRLAKWNGTSWEQVGPGLGGTLIQEIIPFQNDLYIFGTFTELGDGTPVARGTVRWDGTQFHSLPAGGQDAAPGEPTGTVVSGALVWDDGITGESLYLVGSFGTLGGVLVRGIGRWDGTAWHAVGGGATASNGNSAHVRSIGTFDDGTGEQLYIGSNHTSRFVSVGGVPAQFLAKWNGNAWSAVTDVFPTQTSPNPHLNALKQFNDANGDRVLWVGGQFTLFNDSGTSITANKITRWVCDAPQPPTCYANCDNSTTEPILNVEDFVCFINQFAQGIQLTDPQQQITHYANCDNSTTEPVLNVEDFICFINEFAQGCS